MSKIEEFEIGKKYKINWSYPFTIYEINYNINQGFDIEKFCLLQENPSYNKFNLKFEFLGMGYHPSGHFHKEFAKVKIGEDILLIPHQLLTK